MKRLLAALLSLLLLLPMLPVLGESPELPEEVDPEAFREQQLQELYARLLPETIEYNGEDGIIGRGRIYLGAEYAYQMVTPEPLAAYVKTNASMVFAGDTVTYTIYPSGGVDPYTCELELYFRPSDSTSNSYSWVRGTVQEGNTISYDVPADASGGFLMSAVVTDSVGQYIQFQAPVLHVARHEEENDDTTVYGKAKAVVAEVIRPGMSDYEKALALHDWLIYHANYDYTFTYYYPDGVLLHGTGVCQSYALAYEILLQEAGVVSQYVSGSAGGGGHAWNLVKMDGDWYYVDCTWDDPNEGGGFENHEYFGLTSEMLSADHDWGADDSSHQDPYRRWPEPATATYYNYDYIQRGVPLLSSITLNESSLVLETDELRQLTAEMAPAVNRHRALVWSSSDDSVVEVNQSGEIAALSAGEAVITCAESSGAHAVQCTVQVTDHDWGEAEYVWNADSTEVTASHVCRLNPSHTESETVAVTSEITKQPGCEEMGETTYTAVFTKAGFETQQKTLADIEALGHDWGEAVYTWSADNTEVTAARYCAHDASHVLSETAAAHAVVTVSPGRATEGAYQFVSAPFDSADYTVQQKEGGVIPALDTLDVLVLPDDLQEIGAEAFEGSDCQAVLIPEGCAVIGSGAFRNCQRLLYVFIPASVASVPADAFDGCPLAVIEWAGR